MQQNSLAFYLRRFWLIVGFPAILAIVGFASCAKGPQIQLQASTSQHIPSEQIDTAKKNADTLYSQLTEPSHIEPAVQAYEQVLQYQPQDFDALVKLSSLYYYHAKFVVGDANREKKMASYLRGRELALRAMATNTQFRQEYEKSADIIKQANLLTAREAPAMYWAALNWAKWGELYGIIRAAIDIPKVKALMEKVEQLAPDYYGYAATRFFIGYWVAIPSFAGKDKQKSKNAFERAAAGAPQFFDNYVTYANYYVKEIEDKTLWEIMLKKVIDAPPDPDNWPFRFQNNLAKIEAKNLLAKTNEIFD